VVLKPKLKQFNPPKDPEELKYDENWVVKQHQEDGLTAERLEHIKKIHAKQSIINDYLKD
jgi:hypothetical protein